MNPTGDFDIVRMCGERLKGSESVERNGWSEMMDSRKKFALVDYVELTTPRQRMRRRP